MSKSRDIADSAATINYIDNVTSDVQSQLNTLTTAIDNVSVTSGTLTKTFTSGESSTINLTSSVLAPVVSVTKEVPQSGVTNNNWDVNSTTENYTRLNSAPATTLDWVGFDLSGASFVDSFSIAAQDTVPTAITFNTNGTKMFVVGATNDAVFGYTLSTGFDVSTSTYSQSFSVSAQDLNPVGIYFNADGTKMFILGYSGQDVNEYTLSTGFDVSTATYSQNFSIASQETQPTGMTFNTDGTKMFVVGLSGQDVNEYTLSTGFNVSTSSYSQNFSVSAQESEPRDIAFNTDGTKMFILGNTGDDVNEYILSTGFDISTATYSQNFSVSAQETSPYGLAFNTSGTKMFVVGGSGDDINEYTLPATLELGTGSFASADVGKTIEANDGVFVLTATDGSCVETTAPTSYDQVASGSWEMYGVVYNAADGDLELSGTLLNGFDVSTASFIDSFSVAAQDSVPHGMAFNTDGTKMFIVGYIGNSIYEYILSTGFDVSTATFVDGVSVATGPVGLAFNADGTKMYVVGLSGNSVNEYSLSTGFDVSTASYTQNFSVATQDTAPRDIAFNTDGTKMFVVGYNGQDINEYTLSTAFNVSTATFVDSFSVVSQETQPQGVEFNNNGTLMFVIGNASNNVIAYTLSTAFDVSTATYSQNFSVSSQETESRGLAFNTTGTKMFVVGLTGDDVNEYSIGTPLILTGYHPVHTTQSTDTTYWTDINSMTADQAAGDGNIYYAISTDDRTTWTVIDNTDGERDIVRNNAGTWQYNSNGTYASETWVNGATNTELATLAEAMEGAESVANAFDVSTSVFVDVFSVSAQETDPNGIAFNNDGTKMFVCGTSGQDVNEYALSTAFDVSTAIFTDAFSVSAQATQPRGVAFNTDGTKMYVLSDTTGVRFIYQYTLSTGFDVSTASYASLSFDVGSQDTSPQDIAFNSDGTKVFIVGNTNDSVYEYTLSTAFDISTATYVDAFSVTSQETNPRGLAFSTDGTKMFVCGMTGQDVNEYVLSTAFDVSTASFVDSFSVSSQETSPQSITFNTDGTKMFVIGLTGVDVNEYTVGSIVYTNQMDKTQLDAVTDPNHIALGNDLDLSIIFNMTSGTTVPSSDGVAINYDANVLNKGAVLGTDYDFDAPAGNAVRVTALTAGNFKVRVV
jgi:DNA-binding beta-propeller fold protein YncE